MPDFPARLGTPNTAYDFNAQRGLVSLTAGEDGLLRPTTADEVALCDALGLPVVAVSTTTEVTKAELQDRAAALGLDMPARSTKGELAEAIAIAERFSNTVVTRLHIGSPDTDQAGVPAQED